MKGPRLIHQDRIHELYQSIARFPLTVSEKDLVYYVQLSRLDARLAEVVTEHIRDFWWKHDPKALNRRLKAQPCPAAIRPMIAQIINLCESEESVRVNFGKWSSDVLAGIKKVPAQLYFVPSSRPRSKSFDREVLEARQEFTDSGFFSREVLFNKQIPGVIKDLSSAPLSTEARTKLEMLLKIRLRLKGTLKDLERRLGVDRTTLSEIRSGRLQSIGLGRMAALLDKLESA